MFFIKSTVAADSHEQNDIERTPFFYEYCNKIYDFCHCKDNDYKYNNRYDNKNRYNNCNFNEIQLATKTAAYNNHYFCNDYKLQPSNIQQTTYYN